MTLGSLALILVSVALSATAQIAFKFGASSPPSLVAKSLLGPFALLTVPAVFAGFALYGIGAVIWVTALGRVELSQAYPFVGIGFAITTFAGWWLFGDTITATRLFGIAMVVLGVVVVARS